MMTKPISKRMLLTGVSGLLGNNCAYYFRERFDVLGLYQSHEVQIDGIKTRSIDLANHDSVNDIIRSFQPDVVLHCAALTNVDICEDERETAYNANVLATRNIVNAINGTDVQFIYISTDALFDGNKGHYVETDEAHPPHYYGKTKLEGEAEALKHPYALIARTNIFGWNVQDKLSLGEWVLHELSQHKEIGGFTDVFFSSIYTMDLARLLDRAIEEGLAGIYHFASATSMSKYDFAVQLAALFNLDQSLINPVSVDDFSFKAKRGKNLQLCIDKLKVGIGDTIPTLTECIHHFYNDYKNGWPEQVKQARVVRESV